MPTIQDTVAEMAATMTQANSKAFQLIRSIIFSYTMAEAKRFERLWLLRRIP